MQPSFSKLLAFAFILAAGSAAADHDALKSKTDKAIEDFNRTHDVQAMREKYNKLTSDALANPQVSGLVDKVNDIQRKQLEQNFEQNPVFKAIGEINKQGKVTYLFLSFSLGEQALREAFLYLSENRENTIGVFRGMPLKKDGSVETDVIKGITKINALTKNINPAPNVMLDPNVFEEFNVQSVPTLVYVDAVKDKGYPLVTRKADIKVSGGIDPTIIDELLREDKKGDLALIGRVFEIEEPSAVDVAKALVKNTDWKSILKESKESRLDFAHEASHDIPRAIKDTTSVLDMRYRLLADIPDGKGGISYKKGQLINPLDTRKIYNHYVFFNPNDRIQVKKVKELMAKSARKVIVFMTEMPKIDENEKKRAEKSISLLDDLRKDIQKGSDATISLYLMTDDVKDRFKVNAVPALVYQEGNKMMKQTFKVVGE